MKQAQYVKYDLRCFLAFFFLFAFPVTVISDFKLVLLETISCKKNTKTIKDF